MMKLHTQTGSLQNHLLSRAVIGQPEPQVGMGATVLCYTDRRPATIFNVFTLGKTLYVQVREDNAQRTDKNGLSECQEYEFSRNQQGHIYCFRRAKDGSWQEVHYNLETGRWNKTDGYGLRIGERSKYHDFSF